MRGTDGIMGIDGFSNRWVEQYFVIGVTLLLLFGFRRLVNMDLGVGLDFVEIPREQMAQLLRVGSVDVLAGGLLGTPVGCHGLLELRRVIQLLDGFLVVMLGDGQVGAGHVNAGFRKAHLGGCAGAGSSRHSDCRTGDFPLSVGSAACRSIRGP